MQRLQLLTLGGESPGGQVLSLYEPGAPTGLTLGSARALASVKMEAHQGSGLSHEAALLGELPGPHLRPAFCDT